ATAPAAWSGAVAVICVSELTAKLVAAVPPNETAVAPVKPVPVTVTSVPPAVGPLPVLRPVTAGAGLADPPYACTSLALTNHESLPSREWTWPTTRTPRTVRGRPVKV